LTQDKLEVRYLEVDFWVFCFLAPILTPIQVASIDDELWPEFVRLVSTHIKEIPVPPQFQIDSSRKLTVWGALLEQEFKREWDREFPLRAKLIDYNIQLREVTTTHDEVLKKKLRQIAEGPDTDFERALEDVANLDAKFNKLLEGTAKLIASSKDELRAETTRLKRTILLGDEEIYKTWLKSAAERFNPALKNKLKEIGERSDIVLSERLEEIHRVTTEFGQLVIEESAHHAPKSPGL
jgi:hypothetical protein